MPPYPPKPREAPLFVSVALIVLASHTGACPHLPRFSAFPRGLSPPASVGAPSIPYGACPHPFPIRHVPVAQRAALLRQGLSAGACPLPLPQSHGACPQFGGIVYTIIRAHGRAFEPMMRYTPPLRASVAQGIEHRSPKAGVVRSNRIRGTNQLIQPVACAAGSLFHKLASRALCTGCHVSTATMPRPCTQLASAR